MTDWDVLKAQRTTKLFRSVFVNNVVQQEQHGLIVKKLPYIPSSSVNRYIQKVPRTPRPGVLVNKIYQEHHKGFFLNKVPNINKPRSSFL